jgi:hypothetical protein
VPEPIPGLRFPINCPRDGAAFGLLNASSPMITETRAVVKCTDCCHEFIVTVHLRPIPTPGAVRRAKYRQPAEIGEASE